MNIRGTDPTALAAATDLFVVAAPSRDDNSNDFRRALQPPPSPQPYKPDSEIKAPPAPRQDNGDRDRQPRTEATPQTSNTTNQRQPKADKTNRPDNAEASGQSAEEATTPLSEESGEEDSEEDVVAESMTVAANQIAVCKAEKVSQPGKDLPANAALADKPAEAVESDAATPEVKDTPAAKQQSENAPTVELVANEMSTTVTPETVAPALATEPAVEIAETAEPIAEDEVVVKSTEPTGGIGVLPSAVVTTTATTAEGNSPRPATRSARAESSKQVSATAEHAATETLQTAEPTEIPPGSQMVNEEPTRDKTESKHSSQAEVTAALPVQAQSNDAPATATMASDSAVNASANPGANEQSPATPTANRDASAVQPTHSNVTAAIINRLPAQALIRHTQMATQESAPLHIDAARFLQRVSKAFDSARERGGEIRLRLSPPELGALRVEVTIQDQGMVARLEVETTEARAVLLENLPALRERLAEQGLRLEKFDVELSQRESQQQGGHLPDQPRDRNPQAETRAAKNITARPTATNIPSTIPSAASGLPDRQLNVIV